MATKYLRINSSTDGISWEDSTLTLHFAAITDATDEVYWKTAPVPTGSESPLVIDDGTDVISWG